MKDEGCREDDLYPPKRAERATIKGCPFCGGRPTFEFTDDEGIEVDFEMADDIRIRCEHCHVGMWSIYFSDDSIDELINRWNTRVKG